jgi:hypothetical protein
VHEVQVVPGTQVVQVVPGLTVLPVRACGPLPVWSAAAYAVPAMSSVRAATMARMVIHLRLRILVSFDLLRDWSFRRPFVDNLKYRNAR